MVFWVSRIQCNCKFIAESDECGNDNVCNDENIFDGRIEDQVDDSETESNSEESSEDEWVFPVSDSHSKFKRV